MKKIIILFGISLFIFQSISQERKPIEIIDGKLYHNDMMIRNNRDILMIVKDVPEAHQLVRSGRTRIIVGYVLGGLGSYAIGSAWGTKLATGSYSEEHPRESVYGGLVLGAGGIFLVVRGSKRISEGVILYNSSFNEANIQHNRISVHFGITQHGIGLSCRF